MIHLFTHGMSTIYRGAGQKNPVSAARMVLRLKEMSKIKVINWDFMRAKICGGIRRQSHLRHRLNMH
jgi:hypothetical protein